MTPDEIINRIKGDYWHFRIDTRLNGRQDVFVNEPFTYESAKDCAIYETRNSGHISIQVIYAPPGAAYFPIEEFVNWQPYHPQKRRLLRHKS